MRVGVGLLLLLAGCSSSCTFPPDEADGSKRYGVELDTKTYP
jgi:hypothetical protein